MSPAIDIAIEAPGWAALDDLCGLAEAAICAAIEESGVRLTDGAEVSILLCDDAFIAGLNQKWRGQGKPTNVLAFPSGGSVASAPVLGDIVIALETASAEAEAAAKPLREHVTHLLVHGFLHLVGYDHEVEADAEKMEALEVAVLARLGIENPYRGSIVEASSGA